MKFHSWFAFAGMSTLFAAAGCDGDFDGNSTSTRLDSQSKAAPGITADVQAGRSRDAIVLFADEPVIARHAAFRASIRNEDLAAHLQGASAALDEIKASAIRAVGGNLKELSHFRNLPIMHVQIDSAETLAALENNPDVAMIAEDEAMQAFGTPGNLSLIGQATAASGGFLGAGSTVAVLDTGTDYKRAPFNCGAPGNDCPVVVAKDIAQDDGAMDTGDFHGTNVAGVVLSVAPSAKIIALDVFDGDWAYTSTLLSAIDWCVQNKAKYNIVALNMSLGGGVSKTACATDPFASALATARSAGILAAVASGNDASSSGLAYPACAPAAVSVGAVYHTNVGKMVTSQCTDTTTAADKVACFSNSASFLTLLAPGVGITAAGLTMSGTSQATPHVAGAIALLAAAQPTATPDAIVQALTTSATMITDSRNKVVKPRLDLPSALGLVATAAPKGTVSINNGAKFTNTATVSVNAPTTSGTATQICLSATATCKDWQSYASPVSFKLSGGDGMKTVYVSWKNASGAVSAKPVSATITLDTTAPTNGTVTTKAAANTTTISWVSFKDAMSGIASYRLVAAGGAAPANCTTTGNLLYSGTATSFKTGALSAGTTFRVCAVDKAGNTGAGAVAAAKLTSK